MRISDWSSDVCSFDLCDISLKTQMVGERSQPRCTRQLLHSSHAAPTQLPRGSCSRRELGERHHYPYACVVIRSPMARTCFAPGVCRFRSKERHVGKDCVRTL